MFFSFWYEMILESIWEEEQLKWLSIKDKRNQYGDSVVFKVFSSKCLKYHKEIFDMAFDFNTELLKQNKKTFY